METMSLEDRPDVFLNNNGAACKPAAANSRNRNVINCISSNEWTLSDLSKLTLEYKKFSQYSGSVSLFHRYEHANRLPFRRPLWAEYLSAEQTK